MQTHMQARLITISRCHTTRATVLTYIMLDYQLRYVRDRRGLLVPVVTKRLLAIPFVVGA